MSSISIRIKKSLQANLPVLLSEVATYADIALTHLTPANTNRVIVTVDETRSDERTMYVYNSTTTQWEFLGRVVDLPQELFFTEQRNIMLSDKDRDLIKIGDIFPYPDLTTLQTENPALRYKLYMLNNGDIYYYTGTEYKQITGAGGGGSSAAETNWLTDVSTFAERDTTHTTPAADDAVKVLEDETHDGQPTWYLHDGNNWVYQGIYFEESLQVITSERNTRTDDILPNTDYVLPFKYIIDNKHLEIYLEGELLTNGIDYIEDALTVGYVSDKIQFKNTIPKQARIIFRRTLSSIIENAIIARTSKDVVGEYIGLTFNIGDNTKLVFNIPPNLPIGTKRTVRKTFDTNEVITLNVMEDEFIVDATRKSLTLNSTGDFWVLEKITDTRWDVIDGRETGNKFVRNADGTLVCFDESENLTTSDTPLDAVYSVDKAFTYPKAFKTKPVVIPSGYGTSEMAFASVRTIDVNGCTIIGASFNDLVELKVSYKAIGRWY